MVSSCGLSSLCRPSPAVHRAKGCRSSCLYVARGPSLLACHMPPLFFMGPTMPPSYVGHCLPYVMQKVMKDPKSVVPDSHCFLSLLRMGSRTSSIQRFLPGIALMIFLIVLPTILMFRSKFCGLLSVISGEAISPKYF